MSTITREELKAALEACLGEGFEPEYDALGLVDSYETAKDLIRYAAHVFLQNPDTKFYLAFEHCRSLQKTVDDLAADITQAIDMVPDLISKFEMPDDKPLETASEALGRARVQGEEGLVSLHTTNKAATKLREYADALGDQLLTPGNLKQPPEAAREIIQSLILGLSDRLDAIDESVERLTSMSLDTSLLARLVVAMNVERIHKALETRRDLAQSGRRVVASAVRELFLFLRAAESCLSVAIHDPDGLRATGSCIPYNPVSDPADRVEPAVLIGEQTLPMVNTTTTASFVINGVSLVCNLPLSNRPEILGSRSEPFIVSAATSSFFVTTSGVDSVFAAPAPWCFYINGKPYTCIIPAATYTKEALGTYLESNLTNPDDGELATVHVTFSVPTLGLYTGRLLISYPSGSGHSMYIPDDVRYNSTSTDMHFNYPQTITKPRSTGAFSIIEPGATIPVVLSEGTISAAIAVGDILAAGASAEEVAGKVRIYNSIYGDGGKIQAEGPGAEILGLYGDGLSAHLHGEIIAALNNDLGAEAVITTSSIERQAGMGDTVLGAGNEALLDLVSTDISVGDSILIKEGPNRGAYEVTLVVGDRVTLDRDLPEHDPAMVLSQRYVAVRETIEIKSVEVAGLNSSITADPGSAALFGMTTTTQWGSVSDVQMDSKPIYARVGDYFDTTSRFVIEKIKGDVIILDNDVSMNMGEVSCTITSSDKEAYDTIKDNLLLWTPNWNLPMLRATVNRALSVPSLSHRTQLSTILGQLVTTLDNLSAIIDTAPTRKIDVVDDVIKTLEERKLSKSVADLQQLQFADFFDTQVSMSWAEEAYTDLAQILSTFYPNDMMEETEEVIVDVDVGGLDE